MCILKLEFILSYPYHYLRCGHQNAGQNRDMKIANRSSEIVTQVRYLATKVTTLNLIQGKIKWRLNSGNTIQSIPFFILVDCL